MTLPIIPRPVSCRADAGEFVLDQSTCVVGTQSFVKHLRRYLSPATALNLSAVETAEKNVIRASIDPSMRNALPGAYRLRVAPDAVDLTAGEESGLFYALQTLRQLLPVEVFGKDAVPGITWSVPCVRIEDQPRFQWRGILLDCSRYFFSVDFVKKFIDDMTLHKFNVFHWHLTDDQGWRIESRKYPKLTEVGAWRAETMVGHSNDRPMKFDGLRYGGFYTQSQIRDIVAYAAERHVTIVPEIELPGHSRAAIAAYPELGNVAEPLTVGTVWGVEKHILNSEESTIQFYQDVLSEVLDLFPSTFIHIGGDEAVKDEWKTTPRVQKRIRELGLKDEDELQAHIIKRMDEFLAARGRRLVGWDEILEGELAPGATVASWRGDAGGVAAAKHGHDVIMTPQNYVYLDYYQSEDRAGEPLAIGGFLPLEKAYAFPVVPAELNEEQAKHILGGQAMVWTEYMPTPDRVHYMTYPRAIAIAEALWTQADRKSFSDFARRLPHHIKALNLLGVHPRSLGPDAVG